MYPLNSVVLTKCPNVSVKLNNGPYVEKKGEGVIVD